MVVKNPKALVSKKRTPHGNRPIAGSDCHAQVSLDNAETVIEVATLPDACRTTELANPSRRNLEYGEHFILGIWCRPGKLDVIRRQAHSSSEARGCLSIERAERHTWNEIG